MIISPQYQIEPLKRVCEQHMCPELSTKTVLDGLLFADTHGITKLRDNCIEYFNCHSAEVLKQSDKWAHFVASANAPLLGQLYHDLAAKHARSNKTIKAQKQLIENLRNDRPENYSARLNKTKEYCRIGSWTLFIVLCIAMAGFMSYAIYVGITLSLSYTVLAVLFGVFVIVRYGIDVYHRCVAHLAARRNRRSGVSIVTTIGSV